MTALEAYNYDAEIALLSLVVKDQSLVHTLGLNDDHLSPQGQAVWRGVLLAEKERRAVTDVELKGKADPKFLAEIFNVGTLPMGIASQYVPLILQKFEERRARLLAQAIIDIANDQQIAPADKPDLINAAYVAFLRQSDSSASVAQVMADVRNHFEDLYKGVIHRGFEFGLPGLDKLLVVEKHGVYVFAGRPGTGKTAFFLDALTRKQNGNRRVFYASVEVRYQNVLQRITNNIAGWNPRWMAKNGIQPTVEQVQKHRESVNIVDRMFMADRKDPRLYVHYGVLFEPFLASIRRRHYANPYDVIIVDHITMMDMVHGKENRALTVSRMMTELNNLSVELGRPILVASQMSRANDNQYNTKREPNMSDLKESGGIEEIATSTGFIFPDLSIDPADFEKMKDRPLVLKIGKSRNDELGRIGLIFHTQTNRFSERAL